MQTKIRFLDLPGVKLLESEAMIADKFRQSVPLGRVDEVSRAIFGTTETEIRYDPPQWFVDGFDSLEEWEAAPEVGDEEEEFGDDWDDEVGGNGDAESPQREAVERENQEFHARMEIDCQIRDDYDRMQFAATFGFDFSDHTGKHPLHVTKLFFKQALAVARGVKGHLPDLAELGTKEWGEKLEDEARRFKSKKR